MSDNLPETTPQSQSTILNPQSIRILELDETRDYIGKLESSDTEWNPVTQRRLVELRSRLAEIEGGNFENTKTKEYESLNRLLQFMKEEGEETADMKSLRFEALYRSKYPESSAYLDAPIDGIYVDFLTINDAELLVRQWGSSLKKKLILEIKSRQDRFGKSKYRSDLINLILYS